MEENIAILGQSELIFPTEEFEIADISQQSELISSVEGFEIADISQQPELTPSAEEIESAEVAIKETFEAIPEAEAILGTTPEALILELEEATVVESTPITPELVINVELEALSNIDAATIVNDVRAEAIANSGTDVVPTIDALDAINESVLAIEANLSPISPPCRGKTIFGTDEPDTIAPPITTPCDDRVFAGGGDDVVIGSLGNDFIFGEAGNDTLAGGAGVDAIEGGAGIDILDGGEGNDILDGGEGNDILDGEKGSDRLFGDSGDDVAFGGAGDDRINTDDGNDVAFGGTGNDLIFGGLGDDTIAGVDRTGNNKGLGEIDTLQGGAGSDKFLLGDANQYYYNDNIRSGRGTSDYGLIEDFTLGEDSIQLNGSARQYRLLPTNSISSALPSGTAILRNKRSSHFFSEELVGVVENNKVGVVRNINFIQLSSTDTSQFTTESSLFSGELVGVVENINSSQLSLTDTSQFTYV